MQELLTVCTSACQTFNSPELFEGKRYSQFIEDELVDIEIIRFVVGE